MMTVFYVDCDYYTPNKNLRQKLGRKIVVMQTSTLQEETTFKHHTRKKTPCFSAQPKTCKDSCEMKPSHSKCAQTLQNK